PPEMYALSLHDALPISAARPGGSEPVPDRPPGGGPGGYGDGGRPRGGTDARFPDRAPRWRRGPAGPDDRSRGHGGRVELPGPRLDRKSTRLNSSHLGIS